MIIPKHVKYILNTLEENGHSAHMVGGCVRDMLLNRRISDYDITTSATPQEVTEIFGRTIPTGIKHGTVTVVKNGKFCEVTTYRTDNGYSDGRHPDEVLFSKSLATDLSRRDFTVNAMACDLRGNITDLFGGVEDLNRGIIRCVGNPNDRFSEDALRMFRAIRFCAQLGFIVEEETKKAILNNASRCDLLSAERVSIEFMKTLVSKNPDRVSDMLILMGKYLNVRDVRISGLDSARSYDRIGLISYILKKENMIEDVGEFLRSLRFDSKTVKRVVMAQTERRPHSIEDWKLSLYELGEGASFMLAGICRYEGDKKAYSLLQDAIYDGGWRFAHLDISGDDIEKAGVERLKIGRTFDYLIREVIKDKSKNKKEELLKLIKEQLCTRLP